MSQAESKPSMLSRLANWVVFPSEPKPVTRPKVGLALGGGGTRGFAHIGVIKALEAHDIEVDIVVGTSVGSAVGALYAAGFNGFALQGLSIPMKEESIFNWTWPKLGLFSGKPLEEFINRMLEQHPIEGLSRQFAAVATDLQTGEKKVFTTGNAGLAVRASCAVPGLFQPCEIEGRTYVDGGLVLPVPVSEARALGADIVIAVDISHRPEHNTTDSTFGILMQTFNIMSQTINHYELPTADVVIRPVTSEIGQSNLDGRHNAIMEGERAAGEVMAQIKALLNPPQ